MTFSGSSLETHSICHAPSHGHIHDDMSWSWAVFIPAARNFLSIKANPPGLGNFHCNFFLPIMLSVSKNFFLFPKCPCSMNEMSVTFECFFFFLSRVGLFPRKVFSSLLICVCEVGDKTGCQHLGGKRTQGLSIQYQLSVPLISETFIRE